MDNEKSPAERTTVFPKVPAMLVIKGRQSEYISLPTHRLYKEFKEFARIKDDPTVFLHFPVDNPFNRFIKRFVDFLLSLVATVAVLSWLIPIIGFLIRMDSTGPVFSLQKKFKRDGRIFTCIQFRLAKNGDDEVMSGFRRFLKRTCIDQLPQVLNVLIGDMSIIGPKPQSVSDNIRYGESIGFYDFRHKVKPGIIALPGVMGYINEPENIQTMKVAVTIDIFYVRYWTPGLDLKIFLHAIRRVLGY